MGGVGLAGGRGSIGNTLLGALVFSLITNGMTLLSIDPYTQMLVRGTILIIAVFIDVRRGTSK